MINEKKIDDTILAEMLSAGKSQKECAGYFKCSEAAISKHLKRQKQSEELPESFQKLTAKQKRFALSRAEGKSNTQSALDAYDCSSTESAHAMGISASKDPDLQTAIHDLLHSEGIGKRARIKQLSKVVYAKDLGISHKGLDTAFKLAGDYAPEKVAVVAALGLSPEMDALMDRIMGSSAAGQLEAAQIEQNIGKSTNVDSEQIPEGQLRPLSKLEPDQQRTAWQKTRPKPWDSENDPYAAQTVPRHEQVLRQEQEERMKPQEEYDPFNR